MVNRVDNGSARQALLIIFIDHNNRVVDEQTERDNQPRHGHLMQWISEQVEQGQHQRNGQRQRHADDDCGAPPHDEKQHRKDQSGRDEQVARKSVQARFSILALVKDWRDANINRHGFGEFGDHFSR